ncbi:MAG TPA: hypothetical protein VKB67_13925 [Rhizomicrobium sp.]|nr:hypothetical protein [Rhizomicrobium sp.]
MNMQVQTRDYRLHILRTDGTVRVFLMEQTTDFEAIACAKLLAEDEEGVELWRGADCIFTNCALKRGVHPNSQNDNAHADAMTIAETHCL